MLDSFSISPNILRGLIMAIIIFFVIRASKKEPKKTYGGALSYKHPRFYFLFGVATCIATCGVLVWGLLTTGRDEPWALLGIAIMGFSLSVPLVLVGMNSETRTTEEGVGQTTMLGNEKFIRWERISSIRFRKWSGELVIKSDMHKINAHMHLIGFDEFVNQLNLHTGVTRRDMGLPG